MGLLECVRCCGNSERATSKPVAVAEGREGGNSERATGKPVAVAERREGGNVERATGKPVAVAEEREGGPVTLGLTKWDFNKAVVPDQMQKIDGKFETVVATSARGTVFSSKLIDSSKPLLLLGSLIDSGGGDKEENAGGSAPWHSSVNCTKYEGRFFFHTHSHSAKSWDQSTVVGFMNRFPDTFQTVTDRSLFGPNVPNSMNVDEMVDKFWMRCTGTQLIESLAHCAPNDHECNVPAITVGSMCCRGERRAATSSTSSEAGYTCGGSSRRTSGRVGSRGRCHGRTIGLT